MNYIRIRDFVLLDFFSKLKLYPRKNLRFSLSWVCCTQFLHWVLLAFFSLSSFQYCSVFKVQSSFNKTFFATTLLLLWWRWGGSNSWPPACKAGALPAELHPRLFPLAAAKFKLQSQFEQICVHKGFRRWCRVHRYANRSWNSLGAWSCLNWWA